MLFERRALRAVWPKSIEQVNLVEPSKEMQRAGQSLLDSKLRSCCCLPCDSYLIVQFIGWFSGGSK
jgi:hypothetical protein